ncbi:cupin domain-containing protein [Halogeometricum sp. CBA1124]|uniref:cupin domain-containing protein n=1 Tax=Halogeometricum sp. CBA1124 TaxID=2668071 RepID=UPI00142A0584|nr:cupin domain-containing protein [Halogeometricum sp. CBA1124]MUV58576.1 cupin domain-containing protein [Halogeometricum sp. CBA1124]
MEPEARSDSRRQSTDERGEGTLSTGRPLVDGTPVGGPTLELDPDGAAAALLRQSPHPLVSDPASKTWATLLERPDSGETDRPVLVQWVSPDSPEPPVHHHPKTETFRTIEGEVTVVREGDSIRLGPGESLTVEPGREHTFRNDTDDVVAFEAELPSLRTAKGLYTAWGVAHERGRDEDGDYPGPGLVESLAVAADLSGETTMAAVPLSGRRLLWATVGQVARLSGATGIDDAYLEDSFWNQHVEQPTWE